MQRWLKLPDGRFIDAGRLGYAVNPGTDFPRESQLTVVGTKDEIFAMLRGILGGTSAEAPKT